MKKSLWIIVIVLAIGLIAWIFVAPARVKSSVYDGFAQCIKDSGTTFYGAFWCPHCQAQKKLFGTSVQYLPYVECSTPDGNSQNDTCNAKKIESYPTWVFKNAVVETGEQTLEELSKQTSCPLPSQS